MNTTYIRSATGEITGFVDFVKDGKRIRDKSGAYLGRYDERSNGTYDHLGRMVSQGDTAVALIK